MKKVGTGTNKFILLLSLLFVAHLSLWSQHKLTIYLNHFPLTHKGDSIFIAGNFNNWMPARHALVEKGDSLAFIQIDSLVEGVYEFKFTRGDWAKVETRSDGTDVANHIVKLSSDSIVQYSIAGWKDDFSPAVKTHTLSGNVRILDTAFLMPQLDRTRRIWLYLPPGYASSKKRYPVIYMHDGQNVFDNFTAAFGEWRVDECIDSLVEKGKAGCIVVAIDNGPHRMTEYNPYEFKDFGKGEGALYVDFIANTLKPFIDRKYRTLPSKLNTIVAGSSMGGLISYYAMLKYPEVFGKAGVFSPAFWTAEKIKDLTLDSASSLKGKVFFYMGGLEGDQYINDMKKVTDELGRHSPALVYVVVDPKASHNEVAWRKWFPEFYTWIMADGFNTVIKLDH
jgi:predicted alpha/beta superfamily hydrolase